MRADRTRLQLESLDDRLVPAALPLGGGNAAVTFTATTAVLTTPAADQTVTAPAHAVDGLTISVNAPNN